MKVLLIVMALIIGALTALIVLPYTIVEKNTCPVSEGRVIDVTYPVQEALTIDSKFEALPLVSI